MGLFSFFSAKDKSNNKAGHGQFTIAANFNDTQLITALFKVLQDERGNEWLKEFYHHVKTAAFISKDLEFLTGPDGFNYLILRTPATANADCTCITNIANDLLAKGFGVVINPEGNIADWVFSHGDIVNLYLNQEFVSLGEHRNIENIDMTKKVAVIKKDEQVMIAQPSTAYVPGQTRSVIKKFLQGKGIKRPMILLLCRKADGVMQQQLVFNVHPEDFSTDKQRDALMEQIGWFLPRHYTLVSFSKKSSMVKDFQPL